MLDLPHDWQIGEESFYPIPADDTKAPYQRYAALGERDENVSFIGRPGTYRYWNMGQVTGMALAGADIAARKIPKAKMPNASGITFSNSQHGIGNARLKAKARLRMACSFARSVGADRASLMKSATIVMWASFMPRVVTVCVLGTVCRAEPGN